MVSTIPASSIAASAPRWRYGSLRSAVTTTTPTSLTTPTTTPTTTKTTTKTTPAIPTATMPIGTTTPNRNPIDPGTDGRPHYRPPPPSDGLPNYGSRHGPAHRKSCYLCMVLGPPDPRASTLAHLSCSHIHCVDVGLKGCAMRLHPARVQPSFFPEKKDGGWTLLTSRCSNTCFFPFFCAWC